VSVVVPFPTAREIRLSWYVKLIVKLTSYNWAMEAAFYVVLHSSWVLEVIAMLAVPQAITLKLITEFVLSAILRV
jgi:hypothetical protein